MKVKLVVEADISFTELVVNPRKATEAKVKKVLQEAAREGVEEALSHAMNRGFNHGMSDTTSLCIESVKLAK